MENAKIMKNKLQNSGYKVYGGDNAPYIWIKVPDQMTSWNFFDFLLQKVSVVGTPGSGFGLAGEGYFACQHLTHDQTSLMQWKE